MTRPTIGALLLAVASAASAACTAQLTASGRAQGQGHGQGQGGPPPTPPPVRMPTEVAQIAGTPVVRVGVNFEDQRGGDGDYNDAVMCFVGSFKVDRTQVTSIEDQQVVATTSSHSACRHTVRVEIHHADGTQELPIEFDSASGAQVPMRFRIGSRLEVAMVSGGGCTPHVSMHDADGCRVLLDQCNTLGD